MIMVSHSGVRPGGRLLHRMITRVTETGGGGLANRHNIAAYGIRQSYKPYTELGLDIIGLLVKVVIEFESKLFVFHLKG